MTPTASPAGARAFSPRASWWSGVVLLLAAAPRAWAAVMDQSLFIPQEIYQATEPAHRYAFGWGLVSKEFWDGSRSWLFPGVIGLAWKLAAAMGVHTPARLVMIAKVGMAILSLASVWFGMCIARRLSGERAALLAGLLMAACPPLVAFGSRTFVETACAPFVVGSVLLVLARGRRRAAFAGGLASLAMLLRFENALVAAALLAFLFVRQRRHDLRAFLLTATGTAMLGGLFDWLTLGSPFHSLVAELRTNILASHPFAYDRARLLFYTDHLGSSMGVSFAIMLLGLALGARRAPALVAMLVIYLAAHVCFPQKDLRFMVPILPVAIAVAAVGLTRLFDGLRARAWPTYAFGIACSAQMAWIVHAPTRGQLGFGGSDWVTWHSGEDYFNMTEAAARTPDLCGIIYVDNEPLWTGGYTYLHRAVPIFFDTKPEHTAAANAVIGSPNEKLPPGWRRISVDGGFALWERAGDCATAPRDWTMTVP